MKKINVGIVNYGMGNIRSIENSLLYLGCKFKVLNNPDKIFSYSHLILPGFALALPAIGNVARLTRTNLSDVYEKQYIEFAKSYSYSEFKIATKYAFKPASIPTVTIIGLDFAFMLGNAFLVETVFVWPGLAKYGVEVILAKDLNGIVATALIITTFFLIINMFVDFIVLLLNPRIILQD